MKTKKQFDLDEFEKQAKDIARKSTTMKILRFMQNYGGDSYAWCPTKCLFGEIKKTIKELRSG